MANEFTYASSAGRGKPIASFQSMLDAERQRTAALIAAAPAQTAANAAAPGLSDARTGMIGASEGRGDEAGGPSGPGNSNRGGASISAGSPADVAMGETAAAGGRQGAMNGARAGGAMGLGGAVVGGAIGGLMGAEKGREASFNQTMDDINAAPDPISAASKSFGWGMDGPSDDNAGLGLGPGENASLGDAVNGHDAQSDAYGGGAGLGNSAGDGMGGTDTSSNQGGGADGGPGQGDSGNFAKGGHVGLADIKAYTAGGPTPPGIDDGLVDSAVGDFILTAQRTQEIGPEARKALAEGKAQIMMLKGGK